MSRFVWIDSKEAYDKHVEPFVTLGCYDECMEGFVFDAVDKVVVMDFGSNESCYPTCGTKPSAEIIKVIINALNTEVGK